jgi:hypothetical protein
MKAPVLKAVVLIAGLLVPLSFFTSNASASRSHWSVSYSSHGNRSSSHYGHRSPSYRSHSYHRPSSSRYSNSHRYPSYSYSKYRYSSRPSISVSIGSGHYGGYYSSLPIGYSSCVVGGLTYYTHGGRYYRPRNTGYVVVSNPYVVAPRTRTVTTHRVGSKYDASPRIWVSGKEYLIDEGELFCITTSGLVWAELPIGSVTASLPAQASSVYYKEIEFYEAGGIYFQRVPEGYRLVYPPWEEGF